MDFITALLGSEGSSPGEEALKQQSGLTSLLGDTKAEQDKTMNTMSTLSDMGQEGKKKRNAMLQQQQPQMMESPFSDLMRF